ncbi:hypothetical protein O6H91_08G017700 [Diphasiastrum complanatum]|uniref:Uncharacterized protein n=1 Tax=Diphasiastrum complanatum TaxID=34168 RepID=A0ACC2CVE7_DIPCM|nr:hypothetical protein O6H91_08G017700 [Diphasiastrum complanatum]
MHFTATEMFMGTRKNSATNLQCSLESGQDNSSRVLVSDAVTGRELAAAPSTSAVERYDNGYGQVATLARTADPSSISEWEMDFCSRPILDDRGKKVWELVVCDSRRQLLFTRFYPNNVINSVTLKEGLLSIINSLGVPKPEKVRFFRSQMQTIISKACADLDIQAVPSQRCITLVRLLQERYENVYRKHPGFQEGAAPLLIPDLSFPLEVPDNLRGEQWAFVQLPLEGVRAEMSLVEKGSMFGSILSLDVLGIDLQPDATVPGVAVGSERATPLSAWTNALELASIAVDKQRACLILTSGVSDRWNYAYYRKSRQANEEAEAWEACKKASGGLHFLAVQQSLESESCAGFWLLYDPPSSPI